MTSGCIGDELHMTTNIVIKGCGDALLSLRWGRRDNQTSFRSSSIVYSHMRDVCWDLGLLYQDKGGTIFKLHSLLMAFLYKHLIDVPLIAFSLLEAFSVCPSKAYVTSQSSR